MNNTQLADKEKLQRARIALQNAIQRDKLHPSILAWGFGINHDDMSQSGGEYIAQLADEAHAVDGRPVYLVTRSRGINPNLAPVDFILYDNFEREQMAFDPTWFEEKPVLPIIGFLEKDYLVSPEVTEPQRIENETEEIQAEKIENLLRFFTENWPDYAGHFIHAYQDWYGKSPSSLAGANADSTQLTAGILRDDGTPKVLFNMLSAYYNGERRPHISPSEMTPEHPFEFTFVGITAILVFLFFWRRDKRLSGNMRRVFVHPHGFYMDLYENRKVPGFITSIVALAEGIVWALLLASTFHALKENLIFDEVLSLLLPNPELKAMFISLIWNPVNMLIFIVVSYVFIGLILGFLFRILGFIFGQSIPIGQYVAFVFWAAVSYLPLALLTPIFYRFLLEEQALTYALSVIGFFILWHLMRLYRGLRVMLVLPPGRAFLLFVGVLVVIAGSIVFYYEHTQSILGYVGYYWRLMN